MRHLSAPNIAQHLSYTLLSDKHLKALLIKCSMTLMAVFLSQVLAIKPVKAASTVIINSQTPTSDAVIVKKLGHNQVLVVPTHPLQNDIKKTSTEQTEKPAETKQAYTKSIKKKSMKKKQAEETRTLRVMEDPTVYEGMQNKGAE